MTATNFQNKFFLQARHHVDKSPAYGEVVNIVVIMPMYKRVNKEIKRGNKMKDEKKMKEIKS